MKIGKSAKIGSCVHRVLEILALIKQQSQSCNDPNLILEYEDIGNVEVCMSDFLSLYALSNDEIDFINKTRINKTNYKDECHLSHGYVRYGVKLVDDIIKRVHNHEVSKCEHDWEPVDLKNITNWTYMLLDHNKGAFDPRRRWIIDTEKKFNIEVDKPWSLYEFKLKDKTIKGKLHLTGTIDLITKIDDDTIEICDYKTGQRKDWNTGEDKTYAKLQHDFQLLLYYYASRCLYPQYKYVIVTIFYIRDGGPFTIFLDDNSLTETEKMIKKQFERIRDCEIPTLIDPTQSSWKCRMCNYSKEKKEGTNLCKFIHNQIRENGMSKTTDKFIQSGFSIGKYIIS